MSRSHAFGVSVCLIALNVPISAFGADSNPPYTSGGATLANPLAATPLEELSATRERPLFAPSRQAAPPPALPPPAVAEIPTPERPPPPPPTLALLGIVATDEGVRAIVRAEPPAGILRLRVGDKVNEWEVAEIGRRQLVLTEGGRRAVVSLFTSGAPKDTAPVHRVPGQKPPPGLFDKPGRTPLPPKGYKPSSPEVEL